MACSVGTPPVAPFDTLPSVPFFNGIGAGYNFALNGVGTRDIDTNSIPAAMNIVVPFGSTIISAYLYVNTLDQNPGLAIPQVNMQVNGGGYTSIINGNPPYNYGMIGWCGNTCWYADKSTPPFNDGAPANDQNIYNHVYWADVTSLVVVGLNMCQFQIPGISRSTHRAIDGSDQAYYPGCTGSQGIALLIVYNDGTGVMRNVKVFHGAKLVDPDPGTWGGSTSHSIVFNAGAYIAKPKIGLGAGDAQTEYSDTFCFNGVTCLPTNSDGSAINPNDGNLLGTYVLPDACTMVMGNQTALLDVTAGSECLCWFLFVYEAEQEVACPDSTADPTLAGSMSLFKNLQGQLDYVTGGKGTRDIDIENVPATFSLLVPGKPLEAYLYWNVFIDDDTDASTAILNSISHAGTMIGKCGNTCWSNPNGCGVADRGFDPGMKNQVWRADVTADVLAAVPLGGTYNASVKIPNVSTDPLIAFMASDKPHFPGCDGSQGVVLLVIHETTCTDQKNVIIYDGARLLVYPGALYGNSSNYTITFTPVAPGPNSCARVTNAIGDAQSQYSDSWLFNGTPLPQDGSSSYANPYLGNLLHVRDDSVTVLPGPNTMQGTTDNDCLCWFIFAYSGFVGFCPPAANPTAPKDQLSFFRGFQGDVDYTAGCVGIRDFDTNRTPAQITVNVPGPVVAAYLYWNTIGARDWNPQLAIFDGKPVTGCFLGWGGDTCWYVCNNELNIINRSYRADVTSLVPGSGTYNISIPTQTVFSMLTDSGMPYPQMVHMPSCCTGQGIILVVIYNTPHETFDSPSCCPTEPVCGTDSSHCSKKTVFTKRKQVLIYDGAVTTRNDGGPDNDPASYTIGVKTQYKNNIKIVNGVGDAQATFQDCFYWDGVPLLPCPLYFNPYCGNLLHMKFENPPGSGPCDCTSVTHTAMVQSTVDCLHWFLFVYYGDNICLDSSIKITPKSKTRFP